MGSLALKGTRRNRKQDKTKKKKKKGGGQKRIKAKRKSCPLQAEKRSLMTEACEGLN
jgi:hypothetical protein